MWHSESRVKLFSVFADHWNESRKRAKCKLDRHRLPESPPVSVFSNAPDIVAVAIPAQEEVVLPVRTPSASRPTVVSHENGMWIGAVCPCFPDRPCSVLDAKSDSPSIRRNCRVGKVRQRGYLLRICSIRVRTVQVFVVVTRKKHAPPIRSPDWPSHILENAAGEVPLAAAVPTRPFAPSKVTPTGHS